MTLQKLKQQRRLRYEYLAANVLLSLVNSTPILIYQMGKGGSSSLRNSLLRRRETNLVFHFHDFLPLRKIDPNRLAIQEPYLSKVREAIAHDKQIYGKFPFKLKVWLFFREHFYTQMLYNRIIRTRRKAKIITFVREPIAANISMFFQVFEHYAGATYEQARLTTAEIIDVFITRYNCSRMLTWFDVEMKRAIGIDIYQHPFPTEKGYLLVKRENLEILVLKAELPDSIKEQVISEYLGLDRFELMRSNVAEDKNYAMQYQEFKRTIKLPETFVDEMYGSKFARHFYSAAELKTLRSFWLDRASHP